jgi:hypothetical protein
VRLTLRTLLAYLDDTLESHEIKEIGQKVAESDAAQELVARIKQITRRRRLTTPPEAGAGDKFDANFVAEYLDNELTTEQVAELEKTCLESDVHLAEVASCHQILTLVLGEPALVPPTARERMYGLVKGREAIPFRKAPLHAAADGEDRDDGDLFLGGLPSSRGWMIWALPLAAALLLAALAFAVWQALPPERIAVANNKPNPPPAVAPDKVVDHTNDGKPVEPTPMPVEPTPMPVEPTPAPPPDPRPNPPNKGRVAAGRYVVPPASGPSILVNRESDKPGWQRLTTGAQVFTADDLVSLPGYQSELDLGPDGGAHLLLHGHVPEYSAHFAMDLLMESAVQLHQPDAGFDLDLTLDRGRIYLSNHKSEGAVQVRLRFANEIWDMTLLEPGTEIGVDLAKVYTRSTDYRNGEAPLQQVIWHLITGRAGVKYENREFGNVPAPAFISWDNKGPGAGNPTPIGSKDLPDFKTVWTKAPPAGATKAEADRVQLMRDALLSLSGMMSEKKAVDTALLEARQKEEAPMLRILAIYSFGAVDAVDKLLDVISNDDAETHAPGRNAAILTLRRWLARDPDNGNRLFDAKKETGLLVKYNKRTSDAQATLDFLHDFSKEDAAKPATFDLLVQRLRSDQLAVRELAYWQLRHLSLGARVALPAYNAGWDADQRNTAADAWKALIGKELPVPAPRGSGNLPRPASGGA